MATELMAKVTTTTGKTYRKEQMNGSTVYRGPDGSFTTQNSWATAHKHEAVTVPDSTGGSEVVRRETIDRERGSGSDFTIQTPDGPMSAERPVYNDIVVDDMKAITQVIANPDDYGDSNTVTIGDKTFTLGEIRESFKQADREQPDVGAVRYI